MVVITFILVYILIGVIVASIFGWDETKEVFERSERDSQNRLTKQEWREYIFLIASYTLGWGAFVIYVFIIDPLKTLFTKK
jgi:hypothetical protein